MTIQFHSSVLITQDVKGLVSFYENVLQQKIEFNFGNCVVFQCGLSIWNPADDHAVGRFMSTKSVAHGKFELCFETDCFEQIISELKRNDVRFLHDVQQESWGQYSARFFDPESNLLEIGESIPCFVRRIFNEGNTLEQVAKQTSVPIEQVRKICQEQPRLINKNDDK